MKLSKKIVVKLFIFIFLAFIFIITLGPFLWVCFASFQTNQEILSFTLKLSRGLNFDNYINAMKLAPILKYYGNSIIVAILGVVINLIVVGTASYVLARFRFRGQNLIRTIFSLGLLVPGAVLLLPLYITISSVGLYDSIWGLVIAYVGFGLPTTLFITMSYYKTIPREMEESAYLDGCGFLQTYGRIILPLSKPAFASAAVMQFLLCWNEFQFALTLTSGHESRTLPIALYYFKSAFASDYGAMFAAIVLVCIPSIVVYVMLQKHVTAGLVAGAVKG